jgi:hypothetical protein
MRFLSYELRTPRSWLTASYGSVCGFHHVGIDALPFFLCLRPFLRSCMLYNVLGLTKYNCIREGRDGSCRAGQRGAGDGVAV